MRDLFEDITNILSSVDERAAERKKCAQFRSKYLKGTGLVKQAFDSRRLDQQNDANPRRNLQYYQRSEPFIDEETNNLAQSFFKVKAAADEIRSKYIGEPDWLDSYTRILCNALDQTLRTEQKDFDYSKNQMNYLSELLYVRYRLNAEDIKTASHTDIQSAILNKDEKLVRLGLMKNYQNPFQKNNQGPAFSSMAQQEFVKVAPQQSQQDLLMERLFGVVKADEKNKKVKRTVSITIEDSLPEEEKESKKDIEE